MQKHSNRNQNGFAHIILIVVAVVALAGAVGFVGYRALTKGTSLGDMAAEKVASIAATKECMDTYDDNDLCKFLDSWKINEKYKLVSTTTSDGKTSTTVMAVDGNKSYMKVDGEYSMEVITIDDTTYTKAGDTWWKQSVQAADDPESMPSKDDFKFEEPEANVEEQDLTKYVKIGEEACGDLKCLKYQVVNPSASETTEYIWFDNKEYLIRKTTTEDKDGYKSESVFSYKDISVDIPSPVQELGANQYIIPGQSEPQTMPDMSDGPTDAEMQEMMQM